MFEGSMACESRLSVRAVASSVESLVPSTESEPSLELALTAGLPPWRPALAVAVMAPAASSGPAGLASAASGTDPLTQVATSSAGLAELSVALPLPLPALGQLDLSGPPGARSCTPRQGTGTPDGRAVVQSRGYG